MKVLAAAILFGSSLCLLAQKPVVEQLVEQLKQLRELPDPERANATKQLALQIRQLPPAADKERLADQLANLATEGDPGRETLQEVATTLAQALHEHPVPAEKDQPAAPYITLAQLERYEHVQVTLNDPQFSAALAKLQADDQHRQTLDFKLKDLDGREWRLRDLTGKVVLVNFWATWCPPCRKEMPDLEDLYSHFKRLGLVVLAISNEDYGKVKPFIAQHKFSYHILLDPDGKTGDQFRVFGIPKSFLYDRSGKIVAQAIDMRTRRQFLEMLAQAGLE